MLPKLSSIHSAEDLNSVDAEYAKLNIIEWAVRFYTEMTDVK